jgi:phosphomannomutase
VTDQKAKIAQVKQAFPDAETDELDGLTVSFADGSWANLRPSNTEPLLRLNVEGATPERMAELRDAVLSIVRG